MARHRHAFSGADLKAARSLLGLTQSQLAGELGIARTTVITAEQGQPRPWMKAACIGLGGIRILDTGSRTMTGTMLAQMREQLGLTQAGLAEEWGFAESTLVNWERTSPPSWTFAALVGQSTLIFASRGRTP